MIVIKKHRIACVIPPYYRLIGSKNNRLTPAMHYVAEVLHNKGHEVCFINGDFADDTVSYADRISLAENNWLFKRENLPFNPAFEGLFQQIKDFNPQTVIIGAGDVLMPTVELGSNQICAYVSKNIKSQIGEHVHCIGYGHLLKFLNKEDRSYLDTVILCEAETIIEKIVEDELKGEFDEVWTTDLDNLPILTNDYISQDVKPYDWDYIMSMRGCPHKCNFCFHPCMRHGRISFQSPERFLREIRYRLYQIGTSKFYFADTIFLPNKGNRTNEMLKQLTQLKAEASQFSWWAEARVDLFLSKEDFLRLKEAGCRHIKFGVEAGNQKMLDRLNKGTKLEDIQNAFKLSSEAGLQRTAYILLGCPGFTDQDYRDTLQFFRDLGAENYVLNINIPYQGTVSYNEVKEELHTQGLYLDGEEGFMHIAEDMQHFWGISDTTLDLFLQLKKQKEDSFCRKYITKIADKELFNKTKEIVFHEQNGE